MRLPVWIRTIRPQGDHETKKLLRGKRLSTVCEEARCPNRAECFSRPTAAFMILGSGCTRNCGFCSVTSRTPDPIDEHEPLNVALAAEEMGLRYVVVTSVTRDDLPDGGAEQFAKTILEIKKRLPQAKVEVLTPDFMGDRHSLKTVLDAHPDVFNHNVETVERLYPIVRPKAVYKRSLNLLARAKEYAPDILVKSGFMLGLGETDEEVLKLMEDIRETGCDFLTIGQYLRPTRNNLPVVKYISPEKFSELGETALRMGFRHASSGPLVRSSMNAEEMYGHV